MCRDRRTPVISGPRAQDNETISALFVAESKRLRRVTQDCSTSPAMTPLLRHCEVVVSPFFFVTTRSRFCFRSSLTFQAVIASLVFSSGEAISEIPHRFAARKDRKKEAKQSRFSPLRRSLRARRFVCEAIPFFAIVRLLRFARSDTQRSSLRGRSFVCEAVSEVPRHFVALERRRGWGFEATKRGEAISKDPLQR